VTIIIKHQNCSYIIHYSNTNLQHYIHIVMFSTFPHISFLYNQSKSFSFIVFIITFLLLLFNSKVNIIPLNILTFIGSLYLFHYNPGYYTIVKNRDPKLTPLLLLCDIIVHYLPLVVVYKVYNTTAINYPLCIAILFTYVLIFHSQLYNIYFNYERFLSKYHP
jgi:hypothetical protein